VSRHRHKKAFTVSFIIHMAAGLFIIAFMSDHPKVHKEALEFTLDSIQFARQKVGPPHSTTARPVPILESSTQPARPLKSPHTARPTTLTPPLSSAVSSESPSLAGAPLQPYMLKVRALVQASLEKNTHSEIGEVWVRLKLAPNGSLISKSIVRTSGNSALEQTVLRSVQAAAPFPSFQSTHEAIQFTIPIEVKEE